MKKMIFAAIAIFAVFTLVTCDVTPVANEEPFAEYELDASGNLTGVTLNLNGGGPTVNAPRALFDAMAKASYDFFEVVFYGQAGADPAKVVRTTWNFGASGSIVGVARSATPIDYGSADPALVTGPDTGAAVLFIGKRSTSSLLAVGLITHVNGVLGSSINNDSRTVTFTVHSLEAGLNYGSLAGTTPLQFILNGSNTATFQSIDLARDLSTAATGNYIFSFRGLAAPANAAEITNRFLGIRAAAADPKFLARPIVFMHNLEQVVIDETQIAFLVNGTDESSFVLAANAPLATDENGEVPYQFFTSDDRGLTSFTFSIPVYAVTDTVGADSSISFPWFIVPGHGHFQGHLDNNTPTALGGCVLLNIGAFPKPVTITKTDTIYIITNY